MKKSDLITSKEFAEKVGISLSAVNMSKKLAPFRHTIKGNNYIELKALEMYGVEVPKVALPVRKTRTKTRADLPSDVLDLINSMAKEIAFLKNKMLALESGKTSVKTRKFAGGWRKR